MTYKQMRMQLGNLPINWFVTVCIWFVTAPNCSGPGRGQGRSRGVSCNTSLYINTGPDPLRLAFTIKG